MEKKKCPICNIEMESKEWNSEHGTEESYEICKDGCRLYSHEFVYGATRIIVDGQEWGFGYMATGEERKQIAQEVNEAIEKAKIK